MLRLDSLAHRLSGLNEAVAFNCGPHKRPHGIEIGLTHLEVTGDGSRLEQGLELPYSAQRS